MLLLLLCAAPIPLAVAFLPRRFLLGIAVLCAVLYLWFGIFYLPLYFSSVRIDVSPSELAICSGVLVSTRKTLRMDAVQYCTRMTTPFSKATGLNFVLIGALGGRALLPYLSAEDAREIAAFIEERLPAGRERP